MNQITAIEDKSEYSIERHLVIAIDGEPLDHIIAKFDPTGDLALKGLVPTLLDWLDNEEEKRVAWERILPEEGQTTFAPVLMCPDDCDFWCTIIIAEIERRKDEIVWKRIGRDIGRIGGKPDSVGNEVEWFDQEEFIFYTTNYIKFIKEFEKKKQ